MIYNENYDVIIRVIEEIENGAEKGYDRKRIKIKVMDSAYFNYYYLDSLFKKVIGLSIDQYIKRLQYTKAFRKWQQERPKLAQKDPYEGIPCFRYNVKRTFGKEIEDIDEEEFFSSNEIITSEKLRESIRILREYSVFESWGVENGKIHSKLNHDVLLSYMLSQKSYVYPIELAKQIGWDQMTAGEKILCIVAFNRQIEGLELMFDEATERSMRVLEMMGVQKADIFGGHYIYYFREWDEDMKKVFVKNIEKYIDSARFVFPEREIPQNYETVLRAMRNRRGVFSVAATAKRLKQPRTLVIDTLWEMAKRGFILLQMDSLS